MSAVRVAWVLGVLAVVAGGGCTVLEGPFRAERRPGGGAPAEVHVAFTGVRHLGPARLRRQIEDYMLDLSQDPAREAAVYDSTLELDDLYHEAGFPDAVVRYRYDPPPDPEHAGSVAVEFLVDEGPLVTVRELKFEGNRSFPSKTLMALWTRRTSGWHGLGAPLFVEAELHGLASTVASHYRAHAFLDVKVAPPAIEREPGGTRATVVIRIEEGEAYFVRAVRVAESLRAAAGNAAPAPPVGMPFTRDIVHLYEQALRAALRHHGHPEPKIETQVTVRDPVNHRLELEVTGDPGSIAVVTEIVVEGALKTRDSVIRQELVLGPGDRYDGEKIDAALHELYLTGWFRRVEIDHEWLDDQHVKIVTRVEEVPSRSVELVAGYGSYERLRAGVRYEERNVFGSGYDFVLDNRASQKGYGTEATWIDPNLLRTHTKMTVSGEYFVREEPSFTDRAYGGTFALARDLASKVSARVGYSFRPRIGAKADVQAPEGALVDYTEGRVFVELRWDERDDLLFPKRGHRELLIVDTLDPALGADVSFWRGRFSAVGFLPIGDDGCLVLHTDHGAIWPNDGSDRIPLQERFFNGGESSVRSFRESRLGPKDSRGTPLGGEFRNTFGVELRLPLGRFPLLGPLEAATFADAGNVIRDISDASLRDLRYGVGAGLRLLLPIGPVRFDAAFNPDRRPDESEWVVHFSVGYPY